MFCLKHKFSIGLKFFQNNKKTQGSPRTEGFSTIKTGENLGKIKELVSHDCRITVVLIRSKLNLNYTERRCAAHRVDFLNMLTKTEK